MSVGLVMAAVLVAASLWTWLGARALAEAVTAGQASLLQTRYLRFTGPGRPAPTPTPSSACSPRTAASG